MSQRILITGAHGQLGRALTQALAHGHTSIGALPSSYRGCEIYAVDVETFDICNAAQVDEWFSAWRPQLVFNCAAYTNVDGCEDHEADALRVNAEGPAHLARAAQAVGAKLVHVSTDYVFPGTDAQPRRETDPTGPLSAYGRTKLAGEQAVAQACDQHFIVRTAWLYGDGHNFVRTMLRLAETHDRVTVVDDQLGNPTCADDLAHELLRIAETSNYGVYHCTNEGICSWADFAEAIFAEAGVACEVERCSSEEYAAAHPNAARRPQYSALENAHLASTIGNEMRPWRDALRDYLSSDPRG